MRVLLASLVAVALAACKTPPPPQKQPFPGFESATDVDAPAARPGAAAERAPDATSVAAIDPVAYAKKTPRPEFCEEAARRLQKQSRDKAWEVLKACVNNGKFTLLTRLVDDAWAEDLRTRPDASKLIAKVIANRGGDVNGDLAELRRQRVPVFSMKTVMGHPDLYKGRLVMLRAQVRDIKVAGSSKATARLAEFALEGDLSYSADSAPYDVKRSSGSYSNSDGYSSSGSSVSYRQSYRKTVSNTPVETGLEVLAKMGSVDLFFEPGRQFVILGRFDGVREEESEDLDTVKRVATVSVVTYFEPAASIVE